MILLLAAIAAQVQFTPTPSAITVPIEARIVAIENRRTFGEAESYDRVRVEFTSRGSGPLPLRLCPQDARFESAVVSGERQGEWLLEDIAFATSLGRQGGFRRSCQSLTLSPGRSLVVNLFARSGRTLGDVRRLHLATSAGTFLFTTPTRFAAAAEFVP